MEERIEEAFAAEAAGLTDEEIAALDGEERDDTPPEDDEDAKIAPFRAASRQRKQSAAIIAEHDDLLADILFEITINELEG